MKRWETRILWANEDGSSMEPVFRHCFDAKTLNIAMEVARSISREQGIRCAHFDFSKFEQGPWIRRSLEPIDTTRYQYQFLEEVLI